MFGLLKSNPSATATSADSANPSTAAPQLPVAAPAVDIIDNGAEIVLYADVPGVPASGLEVTIDGDRLALRGTVASQAPKGLNAVHREHAPRVFERAFVLSDTIDRERISAKVADGVATVTLPRRGAVAPRKETVQVA